MSCQLTKQSVGVLQVGGAKALGELGADWCEEVAGLGGLAFGAPQPGEAGRGMLTRSGVLMVGCLESFMPQESRQAAAWAASILSAPCCSDHGPR